MKKFFTYAIVTLLLLIGARAFAESDEIRHVMPAKQREKIVALAQALFEPQIKNSVKVGRISSPFSAASSAP